MPLVAGVDSSTQSCKVVVRDADTGALVRDGRAAHPVGTEVHPQRWWEALLAAIADAGGLNDVVALSVAGQQHGLVPLDGTGQVVRPALLWNDTRSADAAAQLVAERSAQAWADDVGLVPVAAITVSKLRWFANEEAELAARTEAVCLPHDWLTWRMAGAPGLEALTTDRSDASGTGYWSAATGAYRKDLLEQAFGRALQVPRVLGPSQVSGNSTDGVLLASGCGDNAATALALQVQPGDVIISIGTSGVVSAVSESPVIDATGAVTSFADATGRHLPLVCTLNAARVLDATAQLLNADPTMLSELALSAPAGADGLVLLPYFEGERTPNRPNATASLHGLTLETTTPAHLARAAVEGMLCGLADGLDALLAHGMAADRVLLVGGGAASEAVRQLAPSILGRPVLVPPPAEYAADGAARQAAWALSGAPEPPAWPLADATVFEADPDPSVRTRFAELRDRA